MTIGELKRAFAIPEYFGMHDDWCALLRDQWGGTRNRCDCGLDDARELLTKFRREWDAVPLLRAVADAARVLLQVGMDGAHYVRDPDWFVKHPNYSDQMGAALRDLVDALGRLPEGA